MHSCQRLYVSSKPLPRFPGRGCQRVLSCKKNAAISGYTLLEIVVVLVVVGILAAVIAPRFIDTSGFNAKTTADKLLVACRYAETLAQIQGVNTTVTVGTSSFSVMQGGVPVPNPTLQSASFVTPFPSGAVSQGTVTFSRRTQPLVPKTFTVTTGGAPPVAVYVTATGYVYECVNGGPCP